MMCAIYVDELIFGCNSLFWTLAKTKTAKEDDDDIASSVLAAISRLCASVQST